MSRGQQSGVLSTATSDQKTNEGNAQSEFGDTQNAISDYRNNLAKFVSGNPYTAGGEYDKTINTGLSNASDAGSDSLKGALQSQVLRTGQNSAADAATAASAAQQNTRDLSSAMATAQQGRIGSEAGYNQTALGASTTPISANQSLYGTASGAAQGDLGTAAQTAATPGFWDEVGAGLAAIPAAAASGASSAAVKGCWIAEACYGMDDWRTHVVRHWLNNVWGLTFPGNVVMAVYLAIGKQVAWCVRRSKLLKWAITPLFNKALARARKEE